MESLPNSERFLTAFNAVERQLQRYYRPRKRAGFMQMLSILRRVEPLIARHADDLEQYSALRNCIVHTRAGGRVIAEPHLDTVLHIERILAELQRPPRVTSLMVRRPFTADLSTPLRVVVERFLENDFQRCPVVHGGEVRALVTAKAVTLWLAAAVRDNGEIPLSSLLRRTTVEDLLPYAARESYGFLSPRATVPDAVSMFKGSVGQGRHLMAILVTHGGEPTAPVLGIVTPSDLPRALEEEGRA